MNRLYRTATTAVLLIAGALVGCGSSAGLVEMPLMTIEQRLQQALDEAVTAGLPAVSLAVSSATFEFSGAAGFEDLETQIPVSPDHRFYLASVGKTYTAVAILRLVFAGTLDLDDPIARWLPTAVTERIPHAANISLRQLLNHTSGIFDFQNDGDDWNEAFQADPERQWSNAATLPYFLDRPLHFEPGADYRYSNSNYVLAALIAEAATGTPLRDIIRYQLLEPAGLHHTVHGNEAAGLANLVHGYVDDEGKRVDAYPWYSHFGVADGGMQASMPDLVRFVRIVLTTDLILDEAMREVFTTPSGLGQPASDYALGIQTIEGEAPGEYIYGHSGKDPGYQADFLHVQTPSGSLTLALAAGGSFEPYDTTYQWLLQTVLEILADLKGGV